MYELNALDLPLHGVRLIEASAGTGKTYVLVILYIRLLLHLGGKSAFFRPLTIQEILVVTFTNTAVQLLRNRIRENIRQFRLDCMRGYSNNYFFSQLLVQIHDINYAIHQLLEAEKKIHQASIFTIHSFCQKVLMQNTIELNMLFNTSIINNEKILYEQACSDFWKRYFCPLPVNIVSLIQEYWPNLNIFIKDISPYIYGKMPLIKNIIFSKKKDIFTYYTQIIANIENIKKQWNLNKNEVLSIKNNCKINHKIYNEKNLKYWINKINQWTQQPTIDHIIPDDLKRFKSSTLQININDQTVCIHSLFDKIEKLYLQFFSLKSLIFDIAIHEIRQDLKKIKYFTSEVTFNDLIDLVEYNLTNNKENNLAHIIRTRYPIAIIDEFQDTDQQQCKIFNILYYHYYKKNGLILIGDPKQAIYSFRGADIFSYMQTRRTICNQYTLNINWRSSRGMINAVNQLFQYTTNPFIFHEIPFIPSKCAYHNNTHRFLINNQLQTAMCFWLHPKEIVTIDEYKQTMAQECSITLYNLLSKIHNKSVWIENNNYKRMLQASDITILVRNHEEASLIQNALSKLNISTVFLSNKTNIFETIESYDLLLLLQAVLYLDHNMICTALTTVLFGLNATDIEKINKNEVHQAQIIDEFYEYSSIWKNKGIYSMICKILFTYKTPEKLLSIQDGENKLINILHLGELLQNISAQLENEYQLTQWLLLKITYSKKECISAEELLRFNNNYQCIKISTIHKSKGLEFPLTFLPFIANFNYKKTPFFHDRKSHTACLNFDQSTSDHTKLIDEERLSEDVRLLYVAITRSIYHCSIGIAPIILKYKKKPHINNDLHHCALGYLIQQKKPGNATLLKQHLQILNARSYGDISFRYIIKSQQMPLSLPVIKPERQYLSAKSWITPKDINSWTITSYSKLKYIDTSKYFNFNAQININDNTKIKKNEISITPHTFPKGKICGDFFHNIFEIIDFTKSIDQSWLKTQIDKYNFNSDWNTVIQEWIYTIINTPLNKENLTLSKIDYTNKQTEFKFYLPINADLTSQTLDSLCKCYDPLSYKSPKLNFLKIKGMLQGFIDLIFRWNKKYYLLDYKTNWLGENNDAYTHSKIEAEITKQCYTLQYQLYTLALHRFLQHRVTSYNYNKDFGGIYYLFIRGMNGTHLSNGVYFIHPLSSIFIKKLDNLFSGK